MVTNFHTLLTLLEVFVGIKKEKKKKQGSRHLFPSEIMQANFIF